MARFLFLNPPLVLDDDFIDYPYFANQGLIAAVRERFPRSVLLLADGYIGGQHYADYDADRVLAEYPELDAILKYPGERYFADPESLTRLGDARVVLRDANGRGGDPLEPFYFLDGIDVGSFDRLL